MHRKEDEGLDEGYGDRCWKMANGWSVLWLYSLPDAGHTRPDEDE